MAMEQCTELLVKKARKIEFISAEISCVCVREVEIVSFNRTINFVLSH